MAKKYNTKPPVACKEALMRCDRSKVNEQSHEKGDSNWCKPIRDQAQEMRACMEGIVFLVYSGFAHENSILGEKPQVLLILPKPVVIIKHKHSVQESKWEFILKAFWKLSNEANDQVNLKHKQEKAAKAFQKRAVCSYANQTQLTSQIQTVCKALQWRSRKFTNGNIQILWCYWLLTSMIQDQVKERKSLGSDCAVIKDVKDLSSIESSKTHLFATLKLKELKASKCNLLSLFVDVFLNFYWLIIWHIKQASSQNLDTFRRAVLWRQ